MPPFTLRERLRYSFDRYMSRGTVALVLGLAAVSALVVVIASVFIWVVGWEADRPGGILEVLWRSLIATFDPALVGGETGSAGFLLTLLAVTFAGIFLTSVLIGILATGIEGRLAELRKGRSRVIEVGQTVILGWSPQIFTMLSELTLANENQRHATIVVLADRDKVEMEDQIRERVAPSRRVRIVCRTGSPIDRGDLEMVGIGSARSIVILSAPTRDADARVIKTLLAVNNTPRRGTDPHRIVAEIWSSANLEVARIAGRREAQLVVVGDRIAQIIAQTCRQSGLSAVYHELLDFAGDEIYMADPPPELVGMSFGAASLAFDDSTLIGIREPGGAVRLNPAGDWPIGADDRLIAISADDDTIRAARRPVDDTREDLIVAPLPRSRAPERTLILDWSRRAPAIISDLDRYVAPGSVVTLMAEHPQAEAVLGPVRAGLVNTSLAVRHGDPTDPVGLEAVCADGFDHVVVLSDDDLDPQSADARTIITLLHLRDIDSRGGYRFSITSEMLDARNRELAEVARADDFIVSDRIASLLLAQLSENPHLEGVYDDLFDPERSEISLRPAGAYVVTGEPLTWATVVESARRRGECAIGFRRMRDPGDPGAVRGREHGVVINPAKSAVVTLDAADRVIVLAEDS